MAFKAPENVQETTTTTGQGTVTLGGAATGRFTFSSQLSTGDTVFYTIEDGTDLESGIGTYTNTSGQQLSRDTVLYSTAGTGIKVTWATGTRNVIAGLPGAVVESLLDPGAANGLVAQTAARAYARRTLQNGGGINIVNPDGVAGNPSLNIDPAFSNIFTAPQSLDGGLDIQPAGSTLNLIAYAVTNNDFQIRFNDDGAGNQIITTQPSYAIQFHAAELAMWARPAWGSYTQIFKGCSTSKTLDLQTTDLVYGGKAAYLAGGTKVAIADGGTNAGTAAQAKINLGIKEITTIGPFTISTTLQQIAHVLSARPRIVSTYLINTTAELGYSKDDMALINPQNPNISQNDGTTFSSLFGADVNNVFVRMGSTSGLYVLNKTAGAFEAAVTPSSWELYVDVTL